MNEEMNKQQEAEVKAEAPVETMEDYAAELEASYKAFDERHFELPETDDAEAGGRLVAALAAVLCAMAGEQAGRAGTCCRCGSGRRRGLLCYGSGRRAA